METPDVDVFSVEKIQQKFDPYQEAMWDDRLSPLSRTRINKHYANITDDMPYDVKRSHEWRVAWLAHHKINTPIQVDVGVFAPFFKMEDGVHRLSAAIYLEQSTIPVCVSGAFEWINMFLADGETPHPKGLGFTLDS